MPIESVGGTSRSMRELNRALLARQHLLEPAGTTIPRTLARVGGLQAQYAPSMYVGLWSRMRDVSRDDLTRELERRTVVQGTLMRVTIHAVARADYWPFALATREGRRSLWLRAQRGAIRAAEMAEAAQIVREALSTTDSRTLHRTQIEELVGKLRASGVGLWIDLVRVPPSGTWERRRADLYAAAEDWIGPPDVTPETAVDHLVRRYLAAFGPASRADIASYSGLQQQAIAPALDRLPTRRLCSSETGQELVDLPRAPLPPADTPAPVRFLPTWDATLLVHARRAGILPEEHRPKIFSVRNPHSHPTFLVDGAVAGTWRHLGGRVELAPFSRLDPAARRALDEEADRLAELYA